MENQLFRKKTLERISSPEELHDYMRVTSPRLWMLLAAILILLTGFVVYASTATLENTVAIQVEVKSLKYHSQNPDVEENAYYSRVTCRLPETYLDRVKTGMPVRIGDFMGEVKWLSSANGEEITLTIVMDQQPLPLEDGEYEAELILETTTPVSFLWN